MAGDEMLNTAAFTLSVRLIAYGMGAVVSIWVARALGPHERGVWSVCLLVATILGLLIDGGLGTASLYLVRRNSWKPAAVLGTALKLLAISGLTWTTLAVLVMLAVERPLDDVSKSVLALAIVASSFGAAASVARQMLNGLGDLAGTNINILLQAVSLPVALLPALVQGPRTAGAALAAYTVSLMVTAGLAFRRLAPACRPVVGWSPELARPMITYGLKSQLVTVIMILAYRSDLLLVTHFLGVTAAGIYSVALTLSEILRGIAETAQMLVVGHAAKADLADYSQATARKALILTAVAGASMAAGSLIIVPLVFGEPYRDAVNAFWWLAPGIVALGLSYSLSPLLFLQGRIMVNAFAAGAGLATLWLVGVLGPGAPTLTKFAAASSFAYWVLMAVQVAVLRLRGDVRLEDLIPRLDDVRSLRDDMRSLASSWS